MNHFLLAFMAVGFLDMSISCIYIAEPTSPLCMVGIMMFFIASLFLTFWSANEKADVTRKERVPWKVGKKHRPEIQKQGSWYSGIMFLEAGGASCCFLIVHIQIFFGRYGFSNCHFFNFCRIPGWSCNCMYYPRDPQNKIRCFY